MLDVRSFIFHTACALSAPSGHLPLEGKADDTRIASVHKTFGHRLICIRGDAATAPLSPSYQSTHSTFLPPSFGRRCPERAEVGSRSGISHTGIPTPPRFARLPLPEEGARMILNRTSPPMFSRRCRHRTPELEASDFTRRLLSRLCRLCIYVRVPCMYRDR